MNQIPITYEKEKYSLYHNKSQSGSLWLLYHKYHFSQKEIIDIYIFPQYKLKKREGGKTI